MKRNKVVILDNGHGKNTPGKRSPDGLFFEWEWTRSFVRLLKSELELLGYTVFDIVPEDDDIGLSKRASRANAIITEYGAGNCIFISVHNNAAGTSGWSNATGWECFTTVGQNNSDRLADCLCAACEDVGIRLRSDMTDGDKDKEDNFTVIYKTNCPAVLTENMFMDNKKDIEFLTSEDGINRLLNLHLIGIQQYFGYPIAIIKK